MSLDAWCIQIIVHLTEKQSAYVCDPCAPSHIHVFVFEDPASVLLLLILMLLRLLLVLY